MQLLPPLARRCCSAAAAAAAAAAAVHADSKDSQDCLLHRLLR
jgi:hypothetical protein